MERRAMPRRIPYAGSEHQSREVHAHHVHHSGAVSYYGNAETVMAVCKRPKSGRPWVEVIGEDGKNIWGEDFRYSDYFFPEELSA
jgi:hypothetical protein